MDPVTSALSRLQVTLINLALDDRDEPYTQDERVEIIFALIEKISGLIESVGEGVALHEAYRRFELQLKIRDVFG